jgi:hypothetical protein
MDQQSEKQAVSKDELVARLAEHRTQGTLDVARLRESAAISRHLSTAVRKNPDAWFIGSMLGGGIISLILSSISIDLGGGDDDDAAGRDRKKAKKTKGKSSRKKTIAGSVARTAFTAAKPLIKAYAIKQMTKAFKAGEK